MAEQNQEVLQTSQDTPPAQESNSQTTDDVSQEQSPQESDAQSQQSSEDQDGNPDNHEEQKPTRAERRVGQLLEKLKEAGQQTYQGPAPSKPQAPKLPSFISPEEREEGALDPDAFEKRAQQAVQAAVDAALQNERQKAQVEAMNNEFRSAVKEHEADIASVKDLPPHIEKLALRQYEVLNSAFNPMTGKKEFVPAVKLSEIVNEITKDLEGYVEGAELANKQYHDNVSQNQAVPTSGNLRSSKKVTPDTTNFADFERNFASKA